MTIFNSLGSNYTLRFALNALFTKNKKQYSDQLSHYLEKKYQGKVILLYKGREAIALALRMLRLPKNALVAINGFTCYAVYKAIVKAEYIPVYLDIDKNTLNFSTKMLKQAFLKNASIKAVIIQNTLGYPCNIETISKICKKNNCILIEDLSHSVGTEYNNGKRAGDVGDCVVFSFSQDKIIDSVSGGALVIKKNIQPYSYQLEKIPFHQQCKDRTYPLFTFLIRVTYSFGLGKLLHAFLKNFHLLSTPMEPFSSPQLHYLPSWQCYHAHLQIRTLKENIHHRQKIAKIYHTSIDQSIQSKEITAAINQSTNLRFPIFTAHRQSLISHLRKYGVYISDTWYDAPVAPKQFMEKTNYARQCPIAEKIADRIVNLPTHRYISEECALYIASLVNKWQKSL